jgi:hypothetical protein
MAEPKRPPVDANEFVAEAHHVRDDYTARTEFESANGRRGKALRRFVGFRGKVMGDGRRKIYFNSDLDRGAEVPDDAIRVYRPAPADKTDGLVRDIIWVDTDADVFYFSRSPRSGRDPIGGDGLQSTEPFG